MGASQGLGFASGCLAFEGSPAPVCSFHVPKSSVNIFCLLSVNLTGNAHAPGLGDYLLVEASGPVGHCIQNLTCDLVFL